MTYASSKFNALRQFKVQCSRFREDLRARLAKVALTLYPDWNE
jgi:hypothetical protein